MHTRLNSFLRNWKAISAGYKMSRQDYLSVLFGFRHILVGLEKGGDHLEVSAGQMILSLDDYLEKN